jgi:hypothetical protein
MEGKSRLRFIFLKASPSEVEVVETEMPTTTKEELSMMYKLLQCSQVEQRPLPTLVEGLSDLWLVLDEEALIHRDKKTPYMNVAASTIYQMETGSTTTFLYGDAMLVLSDTEGNTRSMTPSESAAILVELKRLSIC